MVWLEIYKVISILCFIISMIATIIYVVCNRDRNNNFKIKENIIGFFTGTAMILVLCAIPGINIVTAIMYSIETKELCY